MGELEGVLLDIDGVLTTSWRPLPGAASTLEWIRGRGVPFALITNTTTHTRAELAATLHGAGIDVEPSEILTAVVATAAYLREEHGGARVFLLSDGDARADLEGIELVDADADVVVLGGASDAFSYRAINRVFRMVADGASLVAMHRNMYWQTSDGLQLDGGAYVAAIEEATGVRAHVCGKPSASYFGAGVDALGVTRARVAMVGDDIANDVTAAQELGMIGVLVRTGKYTDGDLARGRPDHVIASVADLPALLATA
jgi:HAD superfamily hydrolase (TIGR01458 family)